MRLLALCATTCLSCGIPDAPEEKAPSKVAASSLAKQKTKSIEKSQSVQSRSNRIGDVELLALPIPSLEKVKPKEKHVLYQFVQAILAADDVHFSRLGQAGLRVKDILDGIEQHSGSVDQTLIKKIRPYTHRFYLHHGPVDRWTQKQHLAGFIPGELAAAAQMAIKGGADMGLDRFDGADIGANRLEQLEAFLNSVRPIIFKEITRDKPKAAPGSSSSKEVNDEQNAVKSDSTSPVESDSSSSVPASWASVTAPLSAALPLVDSEQKETIEALITFLGTGESTDFSRYKSHWSTSRSKFEVVLGPTRGGDGETGGFFGLVALQDEEQTVLMRRVADEVAYFERNLPGNAMFRRPRKEIIKSTGAAYTLIAASGASGPISQPWFTVVPDQDDMPFRSLLFFNLLEAAEGVFGERLIEAFASDEETKFRRTKWRVAGTRAFLILKHVLGYAAGVRKEKEESQTVGWSETRLLDELRSDLVALYYSGDAKLRNLGLVPEEECGVAILEAYTSGLIEGTATDGVFSNRSKAQKRAQQIVVRYAIEKGAAEVVAQDGHFFARMIDHSAMREAVAELLATVLKMSATGEIGSLQKLIDAYGHPLPSTWRKDAVARYEKLGLPRHLAFVLPRFGVKKNAKGEVKDFVLSSRDNLIQGLMDGYDLKQ